MSYVTPNPCCGLLCHTPYTYDLPILVTQVLRIHIPFIPSKGMDTSALITVYIVHFDVWWYRECYLWIYPNIVAVICHVLTAEFDSSRLLGLNEYGAVVLCLHAVCLWAEHAQPWAPRLVRQRGTLVCALPEPASVCGQCHQEEDLPV